jgi:hypothetical protein
VATPLKETFVDSLGLGFIVSTHWICLGTVSSFDLIGH